MWIKSAEVCRETQVPYNNPMKATSHAKAKLHVAPESKVECHALRCQVAPHTQDAPSAAVKPRARFAGESLPEKELR